MNLSMTLFMLILITGTIITITAKAWITMWIGLEMNLMAFAPMMNKNKTPYENEVVMKYFITQAMASTLLITAVMLSDMYFMENMITKTIMMASLFTKMGASPFHLWFPNVMQGLTWDNCFILMTWQKIAPMILTSYLMTPSILMNTIITLNVLFGAMGGLNQTSIRKLMAYSSISHLGWMIMALMMNYKMWAIYLILYTMLNLAVIMMFSKSKIYYLPQTFSMKMSTEHKFSLFLGMLSLGGMPPFLGFLPKWMIIQNTTGFGNNLTILIMVMMTMITLYFYLRTMYSAFMFNNMNMNIKSQPKFKSMMLISSTISIMGIPATAILSMY